jgi:hypothetical protein
MRRGLAMMGLEMQRLKTRPALRCLKMRLAALCRNTPRLAMRRVGVSCPGAGFVAIDGRERGGLAAADPPDVRSYSPPGGPL